MRETDVRNDRNDAGILAAGHDTLMKSENALLGDPADVGPCVVHVGRKDVQGREVGGARPLARGGDG